MEITYKQFVEWCPVASAPDTSVFDSVQEFIQERLRYVYSLVPEARLAELEPDEDAYIVEQESQEYVRCRNFINAVRQYVCTKALWLAVPHLDLVLTPTGFGVVSNQNVAPASAERVANLRNELFYASHSAFDRMLDYGRALVNWCATPRGSELFRSLFWRADHVRFFGMVTQSRDELAVRMTDIEIASEALKRAYSPEQYDALLAIEARDCATEAQARVITLSRFATVAWLQDRRRFAALRDDILRIIESSPADFAAYMNSSAYTANHSTPYENKQEDSCFFFG